MEHPKGKQQKLGLEMMRVDGSLFHGHLDCLRKEEMEESPMLRVALTDLTEQNAISGQLE